MGIELGEMDTNGGFTKEKYMKKMDLH